MPELPEVETVRRGLSAALIQHTISHVIIRNSSLRWPVPADLSQKLTQVTVLDIVRRGKYLLFTTAKGALILHLGMSGRVSIFKNDVPPNRHDHIDIVFNSQWILRYTDPRRFGCLLWTEEPALQHPLLAGLGPEPLSAQFSGSYLYQKAQGKKRPIKLLLMDNTVVVGIGNIYANETLFLARIAPQTPAGYIDLSGYQRLVKSSKKILRQAIKAGGATLKDFQNTQGLPGYFSLQLSVYGRENQPCFICQTRLEKIIIAQRTTVYCPACQI